MDPNQQNQQAPPAPPPVQGGYPPNVPTSPQAPAPPGPGVAQPAPQQFQPPPQAPPAQAQPQQPQPAAATGEAAPTPQPKANPNSTQNALEIAEIRDGIVIMNDGSFRSVVMVKSTNFDLMSPEERESVEFSYQGFLNSLYFPVQIFIRSQRIDIRPYIERLTKMLTQQENMLLALMIEDYIQYISILSQEANIMDKNFYIVIPYFRTLDTQKAVGESKRLLGNIFNFNKKPSQVITINEEDLEKAKAELRNRVQAVLAGLQQSGLQSVPLDTEELIELYYDAYNPDTATRQQIKDFGQLEAPIVGKGEGEAPRPHLETEF